MYTSLQGSWQVDLVIFHKCRTKLVLSSRTDFTFLYISIHFNIYILGVTCADPGQIENGGRTGGSLACDASITYTCNECYTLTGTATLTCGINGQWNAQTPICTRTYLSVLPSFKNIDIIMPNKLIFKGPVNKCGCVILCNFELEDCDFDFRCIVFGSGTNCQRGSYRKCTVLLRERRHLHVQCRVQAGGKCDTGLRRKRPVVNSCASLSSR